MAANQLTFLEELEPRIAPATFVMGTDSVITGTGADANLVDHASDAALVGYTAPAEGYAFLLKKGDKLVFDADGTGLDKNDATLISVDGGSALFFFGDHDSDALTPFAITGVSVGDKFSGSVNTSIYGGVVTALSTLGHLTMDSGEVLIQSASITKLSVTGFVDASITVGGSISAVTVSGYSNLGGEEGYSVEGIYAGSATDTDVNQDRVYLGKQVGYDAVFSTTGVAGGSISNVVLAGAVKKIYAGDAELADHGDVKAKPLAGGGISNVTVQNSANLTASVFEALDVRAGNGSYGATKLDVNYEPVSGSAGGAGGWVSGLTVKYGALGSLLVYGGNGGGGGYNAAGAAGGGVSAVTASLDATDLNDGVAGIFAGNGGAAGSNVKTYAILDDGDQSVVTASGAAGVGGSVSGVKLTGLADSTAEDTRVGIFAGDAGDGGAIGGSVTLTTLQGSWLDRVTIKAGDGSSAYEGTGKAGGASGSISGVAFKGVHIGELNLGGGEREDFDPNFHGDLSSTFGGNGAVKYALAKVVIEGETYYKKSTVGGGAGGAGGSISGFLRTP